MVSVNLCVWGRTPSLGLKLKHRFENCPPCIRLCNTSHKFLSYLFVTRAECLIYSKYSLSFMLVFITSLPLKEYASKRHV